MKTRHGGLEFSVNISLESGSGVQGKVKVPGFWVQGLGFGVRSERQMAKDRKEDRRPGSGDEQDDIIARTLRMHRDQAE